MQLLVYLLIPYALIATMISYFGYSFGQIMAEPIPPPAQPPRRFQGRPNPIPPCAPRPKPTKPIPRNCRNCGAPSSGTNRCAYCGTYHD